MEQRNGFHGGVLRRVARVAAIVVLAALTLNECANGLSADDITEREKLKNAYAEVTTTGMDESVLNNIIKAVKATRQTVYDEAAWKHKNYVSDHASLSSLFMPNIPGLSDALVAAIGFPERVFSDGLTPYVRNAVSSDLTLESLLDRFGPGSRGLIIPVRFSDVYESRVEAWRDYARAVLSADNFAARDIVDSQKTIAKLNSANKGAGADYFGGIIKGGYVQLEQAGGQISNFLSQELLKLRVDINRQIEAKAGFALNERQETADVVMAFEQAVKEWALSGSGSSGY
ncbi:hypothetical protein AGMMS49957_14560 [Synergistales bacterium]|nr:hypothetical protein AGMMS49957_14560 [Synergistales bacterium]